MNNVPDISSEERVLQEASTAPDRPPSEMFPANDRSFTTGASTQPEGVSGVVSSGPVQDYESAEDFPDQAGRIGHRCLKCGRVYHVSDHPFCPHGNGKSAIRVDGIPGGLTLENYGPTPVTFYSHSERRAYMSEHGLREKEKFCPKPGTDIDPAGVQNPKGYVDNYTLEAGKALMLRAQGASETFNPDSVLHIDAPTVMTTREVIDFKERYARE